MSVPLGVRTFKSCPPHFQPWGSESVVLSGTSPKHVFERVAHPSSMVGSLRILSKPSGGFHSLPLTATDIYVDFGVCKPHTVLVGRSRRSRSVTNLRDLRPHACRIFIEDSCPKNQLYGILSDNRIFTVSGRVVKNLRERSGLAKSDSTDVSIIRELARADPGYFREITAREKEEIVDEVAYAYHHRVGQTLVAM